MSDTIIKNFHYDAGYCKYNILPTWIYMKIITQVVIEEEQLLNKHDERIFPLLLNDKDFNEN